MTDQDKLNDYKSYMRKKYGGDWDDFE